MVYMLNDETLRRFCLTATAGIVTFLVMLVGGAYLGLWDPHIPPTTTRPFPVTVSTQTYQVGP